MPARIRLSWGRQCGWREWLCYVEGSWQVSGKGAADSRRDLGSCRVFGEEHSRLREQQCEALKQEGTARA